MPGVEEEEKTKSEDESWRRYEWERNLDNVLSEDERKFNRENREKRKKE
jgi:hypothetical protein